MPYLGDVWIDVIQSIDIPETSSTTDHALEDGEQITDHIENEPTTIDIDGVILDQAEQKVLRLRRYKETGQLLTFNYITRYDNVVITSFKRRYDKSIKNGYAFSMTLKQIRIAKRAEMINVSRFVKKQVQAVANAGRKQLK